MKFHDQAVATTKPMVIANRVGLRQFFGCLGRPTRFFVNGST